MSFAQSSVECPHCRYPAINSHEIAGKEVICPKCNGKYVMPQMATPPAPPDHDKFEVTATPHNSPYKVHRRQSHTPTHRGRDQQITVFASIFVCVVVVAICGLCILPFSSSDKRGHVDSDPNNVEAWTMAEQFVTQQLKSPSTAEFGSVFGDYQDPNHCVTKTGKNTYIVKGWVDGQNAFGATIRNYFVCELRYLGDGKWKCDSINFIQR